MKSAAREFKVKSRTASYGKAELTDHVLFVWQ
jgi:hypothetical protein